MKRARSGTGSLGIFDADTRRASLDRVKEIKTLIKVLHTGLQQTRLLSAAPPEEMILTEEEHEERVGPLTMPPVPDHANNEGAAEVPHGW